MTTNIINQLDLIDDDHDLDGLFADSDEDGNDGLVELPEMPDADFDWGDDDEELEDLELEF